MVTVELRELEADGIVPYRLPRSAITGEYELTELGRAPEPALIDTRDWGDVLQEATVWIRLWRSAAVFLTFWDELSPPYLQQAGPSSFRRPLRNRTKSS